MAKKLLHTPLGGVKRASQNWSRPISQNPPGTTPSVRMRGEDLDVRRHAGRTAPWNLFVLKSRCSGPSLLHEQRRRPSPSFPFHLLESVCTVKIIFGPVGNINWSREGKKRGYTERLNIARPMGRGEEGLDVLIHVGRTAARNIFRAKMPSISRCNGRISCMGGAGLQCLWQSSLSSLGECVHTQ